MRARSRSAGFSLTESLIVLAVLALMTAIGLPRVLHMVSALRVELAAHELVGVLRSARSYSIRYNVRVAVKFRSAGGRVTYAIYRDGDGDGVRTRDIDRGTDTEVARPRELAHLGRTIRFGFPPGPPPRDPGDPRRRMTRLDDPVRFNRSDLASFDPLGGATPGSLYFTDGKTRLAAVRVFGRTGKVKVIKYDPEEEVWRPSR